MVFHRRREGEECGRNRVLVTRRDRILNEFYTRSANESAIARFVHRIFLIDRSIHFFFPIIPQVRFVVSRGAVIPRIFFENMFSGKKKNRKRKPNYRNRYTFQIYIQFSATFPISLTDFIHSVPSFNILFFFPRWLFETLFGVPEVSVGSRSNSRAEFTEESRAARHPLLFHAWETVRFPRGVGRPTRISIKRSRDA